MASQKIYIKNILFLFYAVNVKVSIFYILVLNFFNSLVDCKTVESVSKSPISKLDVTH